jgi:microcystin-dependent protein
MNPATALVGIGTTTPGTTLDVNGAVRSLYQSSSNGYVQMNGGSASLPGYISFHNPGGTRVGYVGWAQNTNYLSLETENGYSGYQVTGNLIVNSNLNVSGKVQEGGNNLIPRGIIVMWSGTESDVPAGWAICNGTSPTPDLRGRFILGSNTSGGYTPGTSGGSSTKTLTANNIPPHTHTITTPNSLVGAGGSRAANIAYGYDYNYFGSSDFSIGSTGNGTAFDIMPPYYILAYIMKL